MTEQNNDINILSKWRGVLMGFSALWILFYHEYIPLVTTPVFLYKIEKFVKRIGFCGVDIFFLLSGMGLTYAIQKTNLPRFYWNRIKRVMIPFIIVGIFFGKMNGWNLSLLIKNLSGYNFYKVNIYSFLWFIPAIMTFYLIFPFYYRVFEKSKNKLMFMISILEIWLFFSLLLRGIEREEMYGFTNRIPIFLIGVFFGWLCQNRNIQLHKAEWLVIVINLILGLYLSFLANFRDLQLIVPVSNCCFPNIMISVSLCFLIAKGMDFINQIHITKWLAKSVTLFMGFFGSISLEMYCVQEWLGDRYLNVLAGRYGNGVANLIFFIIVTLCSLLLRIITKAIIYILDLPFRLRANKSQNSTIDNDRD